MLLRSWLLRSRVGDSQERPSPTYPLSHPRLPALWAGCRGPLPTGCGCGGVRAWGPVTNPTAGALSSCLCTLWGRHEGARGGAPPAWVWGVRGRALSHPRLPALWAGCWSPLPTGCGCGGARAWGPVTNPTARALASWLCALWRRHEGAREGGASCLGVGRPGSGALPPPTARPSGGSPSCCACAYPAWPGQAGRPPGRVLVRLTYPLAFLASLFACSAPSGRGLPCLWLLLGSFFFFFFCCFSPSPPRCAPAVSCFACFPAPGALGLGVLSPHPFFFSLPPLCAPRCLLLCVFSGLGCPGIWRLVAPPPSFFLFPPPHLPVVSGVSCFPVAFGLCAPPPFFFPFFLVLLLFFLLRVCCVCSGVSCCVFPALPVRCAVRVVCAVSGGWCCWFLVSLPFVGGLLVALGARRCRLVVCVGSGARVWSGRRWTSSLWCPVPLCCVLWRCAAVWCCAVVPCPLFFLFFSLLVALVSCCSPLVLGSGPVPGRFCFCALPVRCCAGVPAPLLSVRCSLALAGLAGVLCCCLLCLCVCCWAWLSSVVSWWILVAPGVAPRWRAVVCPWVLCCAVLLRVVPPGVALLCAVLFRFAPFGAAARCVVSWGAVLRLGVLCLLAPCFVLSPRALCVLLRCVAAWCCSPLCFVPCAPWGVVLCVSCRLCPVRCCCQARSPSVPCFPVLCPVVLCCRVVPWCPVLPPCWVCFLRGCGCTCLKNRCKIS